jgi:hypothetical protein
MMARDRMNDCGVIYTGWEGEFRVFQVNQGGCASAVVVARSRQEVLELEDVRCYFALDDEGLSAEEREVEVRECDPEKEIRVSDEEGVAKTRTAREWAREATVPMGFAWSDV